MTLRIRNNLQVKAVRVAGILRIRNNLTVEAVGAAGTLCIRVHQIFEMQIGNHHMLRERVEITKMIFIYFYSVSSA